MAKISAIVSNNEPWLFHGDYVIINHAACILSDLRFSKWPINCMATINQWKRYLTSQTQLLFITHY